MLKKGIEHKRAMEVFSQFEKIYEIEKDKLKHGDLGYELFYRLSNYKRSLEKRFKRK